MFRLKSWGTVVALALLPLATGVVSASSLTVKGASFTDTIPGPDGMTTFDLGPTEDDLHDYAVSGTIFFDGGAGTITFDAQNFGSVPLTFALDFTFPLDPALYDAAHSSITGNGTSSTSPFDVTASNVLVLGAAPPATNLGIGVGSGCSVPRLASSFLCSTASADAVFAPQLYSTLYGTLAFTMGGSGSGIASQANQLEWDGYFEVDPVPEPAGLPPIGGGLLALALLRRRG